MPLPVATIGDWTITQLVKFIKDILENQPPRNLPTAVVGDAEVTKSLTLKGNLVLPNADFQIVGEAGQPPFMNGWVSWDSPYNPVGFWKDALGFVHLRGVLKSGTVGSAAFTLPPGMRPALSVGPLAVLSNGALGRVDIGADGTVTPQSPSNNTYVVLDGIHFRTT